MKLTVSDLVEATAGRRLQGDAAAPLCGVSTDSRTVGSGELFVAVGGERFDGHAFVGRALAASAAALLVERWPIEGVGTDRPVVLVPDTKAAYGLLGAWWRRKMPARVVGITGSNGKTTTKDMTGHLLDSLGPTLVSAANHNNFMGVPETLLRIRPNHRFAVVEMGTNHPGEIDWLASLVRPEVGVITNVGPAHLEAFETEEGVAFEKGRLLAYLAPGGLAVLHADDPWSRHLALAHPGDVATFGRQPGATWRAEEVWPEDESVRFLVSGCAQEFTVPVIGAWQASNCLAALAVAARMGLGLADAAEQFRTFVPPDLRMTLRRVGDLTLIADCYTANPASMAAAIDELRRRPGAGRRLAQLGDRLEHGGRADPAHERIGELAAAAGVELLCAVGELAELVARSAARCGMRGDDVFCTESRAAAARWLCARLRPDDTVLAKASRDIRLEEVVEAIEAWAKGQSRAMALEPAAGLAPGKPRGFGASGGADGQANAAQV